MANNSLKIGQQLRGNLNTYRVLRQVHPYIWIATNDTTTQKVTIKQAPDHRLKNELRVLQACNENPYIRPLVDTIEELRRISGLLGRHLIWGDNWHIFRPENANVDSEEYPALVLIKQASIFGPIALSYQEIADDERLEVLAKTINYINDNNLKKPFYLSADKELSKEDRTFICKIMKFDPRDRPTAKELLQAEWFRED